MSSHFCLQHFLQQTRDYLQHSSAYLLNPFRSPHAPSEQDINMTTPAVTPTDKEVTMTEQKQAAPEQNIAPGQGAVQKQKTGYTSRSILSLSVNDKSKAPKLETGTAESPTEDADTPAAAPSFASAEKETAGAEKEIDTTAEVAVEAKSTAEPEQKPAPQPEPVLPNQQWQACFEAVTGLSHRDANPPLPCQDSAVALNAPRPTVIVADGAGSSVVSEIGSKAVTSGLARLLNTLERQAAQLLDQPVQADAQQQHKQDARHFSLLLVKHARGILDDLAILHRRPQKDFRCTLLLAIQGKAHLLWLKIGDGALVTETLRQNAEGQLTPQLTTLGQVGKGEFANATTFIDANMQPSDVQSGLCDSTRITGFAAMSDGGADRLVSNDGSQVSGQISNWLHQLRQSQLKRRALTLMFSSDSFTKGTTGDDVSLALCASGLSDTEDTIDDTSNPA